MSEYDSVAERTITGRAAEYRARVVIDPDPSGVDSPRDDDVNVARLCLDVAHYALPWEDDTAGERVREAMERGGYRLAARYLSTVHDAVVVPVWGYSHSGLTLTAGPRIGSFSDPWDSGLAGLAYLTRDQAREHLAAPGEGQALDDVAEAAIRAEVTEYDAWARGDVYGYIVDSRSLGGGDWSERESCWGFIGWGDYVFQEALAAAESCREADDADAIEIDEMASAELGTPVTV